MDISFEEAQVGVGFQFFGAWRNQEALLITPGAGFPKNRSSRQFPFCGLAVAGKGGSSRSYFKREPWYRSRSEFWLGTWSSCFSGSRSKLAKCSDCERQSVGFTFRVFSFPSHVPLRATKFRIPLYEPKSTPQRRTPLLAMRRPVRSSSHRALSHSVSHSSSLALFAFGRVVASQSST